MKPSPNTGASRSTELTPARRWVRRLTAASRHGICCLLSTLIAVAPVTRAFAIESAEPVESFTFADTTPAAHAAIDKTNRRAATARKAPVSSSGAFTQSIPIDVPPGRGAMTPALALTYDSASAQRESAVGLGWSLMVRSISRSTRDGFPAVKPGGDVQGTGPLVYDNDVSFQSPSGEIVRATQGVVGPPAGGALYAPMRETAPLRYTRHQMMQGGEQEQEPIPNAFYWIEHDPSGIKRYYGRDPFLGSQAKIKNDLGEHAWLLVREEDQFGNAITYEYHDIGDQDRLDKAIAQKQPILWRIKWGGNRLTNLPPAFALTTTIMAQDGPLDMLQGGVLLTNKVTSVQLGTPSEPAAFWTYTLLYEQSSATNRALLTAVERHGFGSYPTYHRTDFIYSPGAVAFGDWENLPALDETYSQIVTTTSDIHPAISTFRGAVDAEGFRAAAKFLDYDGDGRTDGLYHGAGLHVPQASIIPAGSRFGCPAGPPCFGAASGLPLIRGNELTDLDGDGDLDFMAFGEEVTLCHPVGEIPSEWSSPPPVALDSSIPLIGQNPALSSGQTIPFLPEFAGWPSWVRRESIVSATQQQVPPPYTGSATFTAYTPRAIKDFEAPVVDLNADGRPDVVLLRSYHNFMKALYMDGDCAPMSSTTTGYVIGEFEGRVGVERITVPSQMARDLEALPRERLSPEAITGLATIMPVEHAEWLGQQETFSWLAQNQLDAIRALVASYNSDLYSFAEQAAGGEWRGGGVPGPGGEGIPNPDGELPPGGLGGAPHPLLGVYWTGDGWIEADVYEPTPWIPGGCGEEGFPEVFSFVPHAFVAASGVEPFSFDFSADAGAEFTHSLERALVGDAASFDGAGDMSVQSLMEFMAWLWSQGYIPGPPPPGVSGCASPEVPPYPEQVDFNSLFLDLNGDSLPDLVLAEPPYEHVPSGETVCAPGHRILINRGYRLEHRSPSETTSEDAPLPGEGWSSDLEILKNRGRPCAGNTPLGTDFYDLALNTPYGVAPDPQPDAFGIPMSATSFTDLNADGRVDIVVAYEASSTHPADPVVKTVRKVLINTGRGFDPMSQAAVDALLPSGFFLALSVSKDPVSIIVPDPYDSAEHAAFKPTWSDWGRFVDLDNDGLVDIIQPGVQCAPFAGPCQAPPRWKRNIGSVPDVLERVESSLGGSTEVEYQPALVSAAVTFPPDSLRPPASMRVVTKITTRAVPAASTLAGAPPAQEITFAYDNFVRDPVSREQIGFETITAQFENAALGQPLETVTVLQRYDVQPEIGGVSVRYPLKGALVETVTTSSDSSAEHMRTVSQFSVSTLGTGATIRPAAAFNEHCLAATCAMDASVTDSLDSFGYATQVRHGDSDGQQFLGEPTTSTALYEHQTSKWVLGLPTEETAWGNSVAVDGTWTSAAVLSYVTRTYYPNKGLLHTVQRPGFQAVDCEWAGTTDIETYEYENEGLVKKVTNTYGREDVTHYASDRLYPNKKTTSVELYDAGANVVGATMLEVHLDYDRRTGESIYVKDPNGNHQYTERDSLGRERRVSTFAPAPATPPWLREIVYDDDATPSVDTKTYRAPATFVTERRHVDGAGNVLGVVEEWAGQFVRRDFKTYDAFGRAVQVALPSYSSSLSDYAVPSDPRRVEAVTDGFDRVRSLTQPDGAQTTHAYAPRIEIETNARGFDTERTLDWRGSVVGLTRFDNASVILASHAISRDGLGRIAEVFDADGAVRRFERDLGGRPRRVSLPHAPAAQPKVFEYCHDAEDAMVRAVTPAGRTTTLLRDRLGRPVLSEAQGGQISVSVRLYDEPASSNGIGRLTTVIDASGTTKNDYDSFGRPSTISRFVPAGLVPADTPTDYAVGFAYDWLGNLDALVVQGLPSGGPTAFGGNAFSVTYDRDAKGRPTKVVSAGAGPDVTLVEEIQFDTTERVTDATFGSGVHAAWGYDPVDLRLSSIDYALGGTSIAKVLYPDYDENGNLRHEIREGQGGALLSEKIHTYDPLERLATSSLWHPAGNSEQAFAYSPSGNVASAGTDEYTYGLGSFPQAATHLAGAGAERGLQYDDDGQLVLDEQFKADGSEETRALSWDAASCLTSVTVDYGLAAPPLGTSLTCNSAGETVARSTIVDGQLVSSRVDIAGLGEIRPESGIFLLRLPAGGTVLVEEARSLATGARVPSQSGYILSDLRRSVLARTGFEAGSPAAFEEAEYDAWGATEAISGLDAPLHQFTGVEPDPGTGMYHFGVRAYDSALRRWLSPDPLMAVQPDADLALGEQLNLYQYAGNNPVGRVDPSGRLPPIVWVIAVGAAADILLGSGEGTANAPTQDATVHKSTSDTAVLVKGVSKVLPPGVGMLVETAYKHATEPPAEGTKRTLEEVVGDRGVTGGGRVGSLPKPPTGRGSVAESKRDPKRGWSDTKREAKRQEQGGKCATGCGTKIDASNSRGHHKKRHADGGKTTDRNHAEVCIDCHKKLHAKPEPEQ